MEAGRLVLCQVVREAQVVAVVEREAAGPERLVRARTEVGRRPPTVAVVVDREVEALMRVGRGRRIRLPAIRMLSVVGAGRRRQRAAVSQVGVREAARAAAVEVLRERIPSAAGVVEDRRFSDNMRGALEVQVTS